jgi:hypothetical protein
MAYIKRMFYIKYFHVNQKRLKLNLLRQVACAAGENFCGEECKYKKLSLSFIEYFIEEMKTYHINMLQNYLPFITPF